MSRIIQLSQEPGAATGTLLNVGVTTIAPNTDSGNAGLIIGQKVVLGTAGMLQSLSFYTNNAIGNLKMALYNAAGANGGPGAKLAETNSAAAVVGWNTQNVVSQVQLAAATYWMAYEVSSNSLTFRDVGSSGNFVTASQAYGTMPATFPAFGAIQNDSWSFYMTILTGGGPPPALTLSAVITPASAPAGTTRNITVTGSGGTAPYTYNTPTGAGLTFTPVSGQPGQWTFVY